VPDEHPARVRSALACVLAEPYLRWYFSRNFHAVRVARGGLPAAVPGRPVIVCSNHPSWWDPALFALLTRTLFPGRAGYGPMDAEALGKYRVLRRVGVFGIEPGPRGAARFLRVGLDLLADPATLLWITAEGAFTDPRRRPVCLRPGIAHLARRADGTIGQLANLVLRANFHALAEIALFHAPGNACQLANWFENVVAERQRQQQRQQPRRHNHQPE